MHIACIRSAMSKQKLPEASVSEIQHLRMMLRIDRLPQEILF